MDRYEVLGELGKGANGKVELVRSRLTKQYRARKVVPLQGTPTEEVFQEAEIGGQLARHTHIVEVFDAELVSGELHIYSEYVRGISLSQRIAEAGPLEVDEALALFTQLLLGLEQAHQQDVAHLDLKPSNLLVGEDGILKIADWGSAQVLATIDQHRSSGTHPYAPPEFYANPPTMGRSADLWSVGVVLYEMLTKTRPFSVEVPHKTNPFAWKSVIDCGEFAPLTDILTDPRAEALQELVSHCLSPIATRFQRPGEALDFLKAKGLYVLPLSETDYVAIDAFQSAVNRLQSHLEQSLAPFDWLSQPLRPNEKPSLAALISRWGALNDRRLADELHRSRLYRNDLVHGAQECREYRAVPTATQITRLETIVEQVTGQTFPRYSPPARATKLAHPGVTAPLTPVTESLDSEEAKTLRYSEKSEIIKAILNHSIETAQNIESRWEKHRALAEIAKVQAASGDIAGALKTAQSIDDGFDNDDALSDIAKAQVFSGDVVGALKIAQNIRGIYANLKISGVIAKAQIAMGNLKDAKITYTSFVDNLEDADTLSLHAILGSIMITHAEALFILGDIKHAQDRLNFNAYIAREIEDTLRKYRILTDTAKVQASFGYVADARITFSSALETTYSILDASSKSKFLADIAKDLASGELGNHLRLSDVTAILSQFKES